MMSPPRPALSSLADWFERLTRNPAEEAGFWRELGPTPVVAARAPEPGFQAVTFVFWEPYPEVPVMVHINSVTDNHRGEVGPAILEAIPGTAVRHLTYLLPEGLNAGYSFVRGEAVPLGRPYSQGLWKRVHAAGLPDPRNPRWFRKPFGGLSSLVTLSGARLHPAWDPGQPLVRSLVVHESTVVDRGVTRRFQVWTSPGAPQPGPVLVLFDGEFWRNLEISRALARYSGVLPPVILVDSGPGTAREELLPHPERMSELLGHYALPLAERVLQKALPPEDIIVCGQSYGGLAAATCVVMGLADRAIVQSGSFQFQASVPHEFQKEPGDLIRGLEPCPSGRATRLLVQVGTEEPFLRSQAEGFVEAATRVGYGGDLDIFVGGHDYAWWRHGFFFALDRLLSGDSFRRPLSAEGAKP